MGEHLYAVEISHDREGFPPRDLDELQETICRRFGLPLEPPPLLKELDRRLLATERRVLMLDAWDWPELAGVEAADITIEPWSPERSAREFLRRYVDIAGPDRPSPSSR